MTLNTTYSPTVADGNGVTTSFSYSFNPISENYLKVSLEQNGSWVEQVSGWTATVSENGGVVTFDTAPTTRVAIERDVPEEQPTSYKTSSGFQAQVIEHSFDMLTGMVQELKEKSDRSVAVDVGSSVNPQEVVAQVERVYSSIDNVDTVADNITNVNTIANNVTKVYLVANNISDVNAVGLNIYKVNAVSADLTNVDTVATNISDVNTVAGDIAKVNAVADDLTKIDAVQADLTNIDTVATNISDVSAVGGDIAKVSAVADDLTNIDAVNANKTNIDTVATNIADVMYVGGSIASVNSVAADLTNIDAVNNNKTNIDAVANNITNVNLVGADIVKVSAVADDLTNIDAVNANKTNIDKVASIKNDVTTVAGIQGDIMAVAADASLLQDIHDDLSNIDLLALDKINIDAVATNIGNVNTVADHSTSVDTVATNIGAVTTAANNISAINNAPTYAAQAKQWAIGVPGEPTGGSAKYWAERAEDAASGLGDPANRDLSNLTSAGQAVIETADGTISNHIKEIPQNIKLTLENNVVTLKAGSVVLRGGEVYTTYTLSEDKSLTISSSLENGRYFLYTNSTGTPMMTIQNKFGSGTTLPDDSSTYVRFFITTNKTFYNWSRAQNAWVESGVTYPIAMIDVVNGVASFAKDSNSYDMIFNGAGFVGHHAFVYPGVKGLVSEGFNADGSMKSASITVNSLYISELYVQGTPYIYTLGITPFNMQVSGFYMGTDVDTRDEIVGTWLRTYVKSENKILYNTGSAYVQQEYSPLLSYAYNGTTVTDFAIRQPVRLATTEMTDKIQAQVDTNTTAISGKQDTLVSGTNIKTINSTTVLGNGNFALADQSLSNLDSNGQMVVDSVNGTISNCVLEIPQNIKLTLENNVLTLKAGSILTRTGSTYTTVTVTEDKTSIYSNNGKYYIIATADGTLYNWWSFDELGSGSSLPEDNTNYIYFFNITDKKFYLYGENGWYIWRELTQCYPLGIIEVTNGVASFAKDSNGNDMIFNGAGFVGHHAFVYPNVKALIPDGFNSDGTLKSIVENENALRIVEIQGTRGFFAFASATGTIVRRPSYFEVNNLDELYAKNVQGFYYVKSINQGYSWNGGSGTLYPGIMVFIGFSYDGTTVTDFTIRQPVRTATTEMLDSATTKAKTYKGTYDATIQYYAGDIVKSGSVFYEALQDNINVVVTAGATWSQLSEDHKVRYYEQSDNVEYPIGLTGSSASGSGSSGYMNFTTQNKPTINASTGVITAPGGIIGKTETAGDNSTKYATTAFVNGYLASITGYDATKTQTLKNVSGTLTWVDD